MVELPYGRVSYPIDLAGRDATVVMPPGPPGPLMPPGRPPWGDLGGLLDSALDAPVGRPRLETLVSSGARVTVIVSDATRSEPRSAFLAALRRRLPAVRWTVAIATGTHGPARLDELGLPAELMQNASVVNHDGHRDAEMVTLGITSAGTPVRVHRCVVETDLVLATGCIRPHYFAGFGAGVKAIFPGLGAASAIRINHRLKIAPRSRAGIVDENPCRADLEDAVGFLPALTFLLNGVCGYDGHVQAAVAGDPVLAFRDGARLARGWFTVRARRAPIVIASDALPVTASLYQAAKIAAAVAPLVEENGTLGLVAECADGIGPLEVVNEAIFRTGVLPRLPSGVSIELVSSLPKAQVDRTLVQYAPSVSHILGARSGAVVVVPRASQLIFELIS